MDVVFPVGGQVVVDHQGDLLHGNATSKQVSGNQNPGGAAAELAHDHVPLLLVHVSVHRRHRQVALVHLLGQPVDLPPRVAEDDGLGDGKGLVEPGPLIFPPRPPWRGAHCSLRGTFD